MTTLGSGPRRHDENELTGTGGHAASTPYDPLRLCIFATVAALGWLLGPAALLFFAALGFTGYWKARRAGLAHSKCLLGDTRIVLGYLALLAVAAAVGIYLRLF
jgi:hypothetical protein